ncbi:hypothetical protein JMM59_00865 [Rhodovulum sulfidophilum]|uniref:hypothetical protein n=1 Tax=Rhodovulum sulfidophilum TaxID=35806 RepID=UPI001922D4DD|nr:hypothetical protein [Rhodovulum sulfidophilum]MBL3563575.1 hypothetical protein [Rhodovulum sulfidophilum]
MPMIRPFGPLALCAVLAACAHGVDETAMVPAAIAPLSPGNPHRGAISDIETAGGKETNPALASQIADADFKTALHCRARCRPRGAMC